MANIDKFLDLFSDFDLVVSQTNKRTKTTVDFKDPAIFNPTVQELKRSIKRLEREYNAAKRAHKNGKVRREELFDYE